jgi:hypothetical protein
MNMVKKSSYPKLSVSPYKAGNSDIFKYPGLHIMSELNKDGLRVLISGLRDSFSILGHTQIPLSAAVYCREYNKELNKTTVSEHAKGIRNLLSHNVITRTYNNEKYWLNTELLWK